jgi:hypothetical protein
MSCQSKLCKASKLLHNVSQHPNDHAKTLQYTLSLGILIDPPTYQRPNLLFNDDLIVLNINDGMWLLLCKDCSVCLTQIQTRCAPISSYIINSKAINITTMMSNAQTPPMLMFHQLSISHHHSRTQFTPLHDQCFKKYIVTLIRSLLQLVFGIVIFNK